jgi:hypothetical protein
MALDYECINIVLIIIFSVIFPAHSRQVKMDSWVTFITDEASHLDTAQARLIGWGDGSSAMLNKHEVALIQERGEVKGSARSWDSSCRYSHFKQ